MLDDSPPSVADEVAKNLAAAGLEVYSGEELATRIAPRQMPPPDPELAAKFSGISTVIASGVERFFYKGNEAAIETLSPIFDLGISHPELLARRPDFADQIYAAGIILVRAHKNLEDEQNMLATARLLVKRFPSKQPSATTVPPKVIRLLDEERARLTTEESRLRLRPITRSEGCTTYLNGAPATANLDYVVEGGAEYFVRVDCGDEAGIVWRVGTPSGKSVAVPAPSEDPLAFRMDASDVTARRHAEGYLAATAYWTGVETIVGVLRPDPSNDALVLVRLEADGSAQWSDGLSKESIQRAIVRVFPELQDRVTPENEVVVADAAGSRVDVVGWSFVAGGVTSGTMGTVLLLTAQRRSKVLTCSNLGTPDAALCAGEEELTFTPDEYRQNAAAIRVRRTIGWSAVAIGAAALGFGVWHVVSERRASVAVTIAPGGVGLAAHY